jgi:hypothetical protein
LAANNHIPNSNPFINITIGTVIQYFFKRVSLGGWKNTLRVVDPDGRPSGEGDVAIVGQVLEGILEHVASNHLKT